MTDEILPVLLKSFEMLGETAKLIEHVDWIPTGTEHQILLVKVSGDDLHERLLICRSLEREMNLQSEDSSDVFQCVLQGSQVYSPVPVWTRL